MFTYCFTDRGRHKRLQSIKGGRVSKTTDKQQPYALIKSIKNEVVSQEIRKNLRTKYFGCHYFRSILKHLLTQKVQETIQR